MKALSFATILSILPALATADELGAKMLSFVDAEVRSVVANPTIIAAIKRANATSGLLSPNEILGLDTQWREEVGKTSALISAVTENETSVLLRDYVYASAGKVTEVIVMDAQGLNVAVSDVTSDYWQGDEEKHQLTYGVGPDGLHVSEVELDESTQTYQAQVSFTIVDPVTGLGIGAATIGLNAEAF